VRVHGEAVARTDGRTLPWRMVASPSHSVESGELEGGAKVAPSRSVGAPRRSPPGHYGTRTRLSVVAWGA